MLATRVDCVLGTVASHAGMVGKREPGTLLGLHPLPSVRAVQFERRRLRAGVTGAYRGSDMLPNGAPIAAYRPEGAIFFTDVGSAQTLLGVLSGQPRPSEEPSERSYAEQFGEKLVALVERGPRLVEQAAVFLRSDLMDQEAARELLKVLVFAVSELQGFLDKRDSLLQGRPTLRSAWTEELNERLAELRDDFEDVAETAALGVDDEFRALLAGRIARAE